MSAITVETYPASKPTRCCIECGNHATHLQRMGRMVFYVCDDHKGPQAAEQRKADREFTKAFTPNRHGEYA
jgi:hypothetical protein